jgi:hypothetical protein
MSYTIQIKSQIGVCPAHPPAQAIVTEDYYCKIRKRVVTKTTVLGRQENDVCPYCIRVWEVH